MYTNKRDGEIETANKWCEKSFKRICRRVKMNSYIYRVRKKQMSSY